MIFDYETIERNLTAIKDVLEAPAEMIDEQVGKLGKLCQLTALAAESQAQALGIKNKQKADAIRILSKEKYSAMQTKDIAAGDCYKYEALYEYSVRISASVSHSIDGIRTQISWYKTELENSLKQPN